MLNLYNISPSVLYPERTFTAPNQYFSLNAVASNGAQSQLYNVLRLETVWYPFTTFTWTAFEYLQLIPIAITLILFIFNKKRTWLYFSCLLIFLFLAKGLHTPGENISKLIYQNLFFMHYFRDPSRFLGGVVLCMSLIIADFTPKTVINKWWKIVFITISLVIILLVNYKNISVPRIFTLQRTMIPDSYSKLQDFITTNISNKKEGRVFPLPDFQGINAYSWYNNPLPLSSGTVFDMLIPFELPLVSTEAYPDSYSNQITAFLYKNYTESYNAHYLTPLGVRYLITDNSLTKFDTAKEVATQAADLLSDSKNDYQLLYKNSTLSFFENKHASPLVLTQKPIFAIGNLNTIAKNNKNGSTRPIILLNQMVNSEIKDLSILKKEDLVIDTDNPSLVLTSERLAHNYNVDILKAGWDYDKIFSNFEPSKMPYIQNSGELFTSGRSVVSQTTGLMHIRHSLAAGRYIILLKALSAPGLANLTITLGDTTKSIPLDTKNHLQWIYGGTVTSNRSLSYLTLTKPDTHFTVIDQLVLVPDKIFLTEEKNVKTNLSHMTVLNHTPSEISSKTQYTIVGEDKVTVMKPAKYLTYHFSYGDYWQSNTPSTKFMSDLYGMTFIANDGKITEINYFPNKVYKLSLIFSGVLWGLILLFVCYEIYYYARKSYFLSKK
ncbi:MAG: hypothetical protein ACR2LN_06375 [Candidatus Levyibacteriota bacterium]